MIELHTQNHSRTATAQPKRFNAPLFQSLMERIYTGGRWVVLDLGAARARTVALLSQYHCRLDVADLIDDVDSLNAETDPSGLHDAAERMLPAQREEATNAVFCWDILNYLTPPALNALMSCVAMRGRPGTLVHTLMVYSEPHMAARPGQFGLLDDNGLIDTAYSRREREAQRYTLSELTDQLPGYSIERAMLLTNGMQEILFRL